MREELIETITDLAAGEPDQEDLIRLAKATDDELVAMVMEIAYYYHAEFK